jgi:hypothetical protein
MSVRKDFDDFSRADEASEPESLPASLRRAVRRDLEPSGTRILVRLSCLHLTLSVVSLSVCHQFGLNPFGTTWSLSDWAMQMAGHTVCMLVCGAVFFGGTVAFMPLVLSSDERRVLWQSVHQYLGTLIFGSLFAFWLVSAELDFGGVLVWSFAAWSTGWLIAAIQRPLVFKNHPSLS